MLIGAPWAQEFIDEFMAARFPGRKLGRVLVSLVVPGQTIPEHVDVKEGCTERVHVPIETDPLCVFVQEGREHYLSPGHAWLIDPTAPHAVVHRGARDRVHLMFNVL